MDSPLKRTMVLNEMTDSNTCVSESSKNITNLQNVVWVSKLPKTSSSSRLFYAGLHKNYIENMNTNNDSLEHLMSEHLRMGGYFWCLGALDLMSCFSTIESIQADPIPLNGIKSQSSIHFTDNHLICNKNLESLTHKIETIEHPETPSLSLSNESITHIRQTTTDFVLSCWDVEKGGFGSSIKHDAHITSTLYSLLVLAICDNLHLAPAKEITQWVISLQNDDGSFSGDVWGEVDGRFMYCAVCILSLLGSLDSINKEKAISWIEACQNMDHAFGSIPMGESHAAYTYCCVAALAILDGLDIVNYDGLGMWLAERQLSSNCGGFNGRPEKAPDVCYSWWICATLAIIDRLDWIDFDSLAKFILSSQDSEDGGIADRSGDVPDPFHTFFGIAGLCLLDALPLEHSSVNPVYALSDRVLQRVSSGSRGSGSMKH